MRLLAGSLLLGEAVVLHEGVDLGPDQEEGHYAHHRSEGKVIYAVIAETVLTLRLRLESVIMIKIA